MIAAERLELSRDRLRRALANADGPADSRRRSRRQRGKGSEAARDLPSALWELVQRWWHGDFSDSYTKLNTMAGAVLNPIAQRHPVTLVLAAGGLGASVTFLPWRWLVKFFLANVISRLSSRAVSGLPVEAWIAGAFSRLMRMIGRGSN